MRSRDRLPAGYAANASTGWCTCNALWRLEAHPRARSFLCGVAGFDIPASTDDRDALDPGIEPRGIEFVRLAAGVEIQAPE